MGQRLLAATETVWSVCLTLNATFNNISVISWRSIYWWRKLVDPGKTIDMSQITDNLYHIMLFTSDRDSNSHHQW